MTIIASQVTDMSYIGKGIVYIDNRQVGNCSSLALAVTEEKIELDDYTQGGGGLYNSIRRIDTVEATMTLHDYSADNLAVALFGTASAVAAGAVTDESITTGSSLDLLVETEFMMDLDQTVTVTSDPAGTTYTEGTDYVLSTAGIYVLSTGTMAASTGYLIDYTKEGTDKIETLVNSATDRVLVFEGLNEAQSGNEVLIRVHKFKAGAAANLSLIGDEFGALELTGDVLKDTTITTAGLSQYCKIQIAS